MADRETIELLLQRSEDDLWIFLGQSLDPGRRGPTLGKADDPASRERLAGRAKAWLEANRARLAHGICGNATVQGFVERGTTEDAILLVAAVADCIAASCTNVAPVTAAVLLVKIGLKSLCGSQPAAQGQNT